MNKTSAAAEPRRENKMGVMPVGRLLFTMALPMVLSMLMQALYNIVDSAFVGMISSENAYGQTALSLAFPVQSLMISFAIGTGVGINSFLSRSLGEKDSEAVNKSAGNGVFLTFVTYVVFALLGLFGTRFFFSTQTTIDEVYRSGVDYLFVVTVFSFGLFTQVLTERLLQATGKTSLCMVSQMTGALINIILDPVFILKSGARILFFDLPFGLGLGTRGAAIATVIGQCVAAALGVILNLTLNREISFKLKYLKPEGKIIAAIYKVGLPSIFMSAVGAFLTLALNRILTIGEAVKFAVKPEETEQIGVTVYGLYFKLQSFVFMPVFGMNNGMIPIVAYNYGARRKKRIVRTIVLSLICAVGYMLACLLVFQFFPKALLGIFHATPAVLQLGVPALRRISLCFIFAGVCVISISTLQALGRGVPSLVISLVRQIVIILPLSYIFAAKIGIDAVWFAFPIAEFAALAISVIYVIHAYKTQIAPLPDGNTERPENAGNTLSEGRSS